MLSLPETIVGLLLSPEHTSDSINTIESIFYSFLSVTSAHLSFLQTFIELAVYLISPCINEKGSFGKSLLKIILCAFGGLITVSNKTGVALRDSLRPVIELSASRNSSMILDSISTQSRIDVNHIACV